jgi:AraC-like DNA-binding protein
MNLTLHAPHDVLPRHQHPAGFAAVVLRGCYTEAGDTGCHHVAPGDVLIHRAFESHIDRFERHGAEVLVVPLPDAWRGPLLGRVRDVDAIARAAERDAVLASRMLAHQIEPLDDAPDDWPDLLARTLRREPGTSLRAWAHGMRLHPGSVSRGFRQVFGVTPASFRVIARTLHAVRELRLTLAPLGAIAQDCGFADQAHMTRAIGRLTRMSPARLRGTISTEESQ